MVTGSSGYLGRALVGYLQDRSIDVLPCTRSTIDIRAFSTLAKKAEYQDVSHLYHLAGVTGVKESWRDPTEFYAVNVLGTQQALEFCRRTQAKFIYASAFVHGSKECSPVAENAVVEPVNPYSHSKWVGEEICRHYADKFDVKYVIARLFNVYGSTQSTSFLIPRIIQQVESDSNEILVHGLTPLRDYVYIDDVTRLMYMLGQLNQVNFTLNIGTGIGTSVREVIDHVQGIWGTTKMIADKGTTRPNEINSAVADTAEFINLFDDFTFIDIKDGLKKIHTRNNEL